ncbi:hypothetical protein GJV06_13310 [Enterobacteriaceae bacterium RIT691]|nr:hypothetical protein [Enterobacteriaceae bacterium RIT691]
MLNSAKLYQVWVLLAWGFLYFALGYLSLSLDDPGSRIAYIWLPAGMAVSAFLLSSRRSWPLLYLSLLIGRLALDVTFQHSLTVSLGLALISLTNDMAIAWTVRHFTRGRDLLFKVTTWFVATLCISAVAAAMGVSWLAWLQGTPYLKGIWIWWSANVTGTLFVTPALVGLAANSTSAGRISPLTSLLLLVAVLAVTLLIFFRTPGESESITLTYSVACIPLMLITVTAVLCNTLMGSLAFILFSTVVIAASWFETGPFYIARLTTEGSIILGQCYLCGSALLIVFIRAQKIFVQANKPEYLIQGIAYSLNPQTGRIGWNPHTDSPLLAALSPIVTREALLAHIPDAGQQAQLLARWQAVSEYHSVEDGFRFVLELEGHKPVEIAENNTLMVAGSIIGFWTQPHSGLFQLLSQGER